LQGLIELVRLLKRERFDLVHTHTAKAGFLGRLACRLARVPVVIHTYHAFPFHDFMPKWKRQFYVWLERLARPVTEFFITVSEDARQQGKCLKVLEWERSRTVYSGIDFSKLDRAADPNRRPLDAQIPLGCKTILMAGRFDRQKAPQLLVEAFSGVLKSHPNTVLLMAGDGDLRGVVEERIQRLRLQGKVRLLGFRDDVPDLLKMADIFALSSLWEGMGRAMTEAMLLGKPVVVPRVNGIPEIVHHGQTGLLYEVGRVDQLATSLCQLLDHPEERERLGANARRLTRQLFDVNHMVGQIEGIYESLLRAPAFPNVTPLPVEEEKQLSA
jgi:glycosyltransferase involved in cell wall biosynthesis